ncbi:MAG: lipoprotein insertase outer membrane protein LolB [Candidatus Arsenophonus melophagi]|nr:lipoprotein insertase outer membrane protein LolB [Candidatus Arsenophonus melophagi]
MILSNNQLSKVHHICCTFILLFAIFLTACTFNQQLITEKPVSITHRLWLSHQQQLANIRKFQIRGIFAYIGPNNKTYAKFFLRQYSMTHYSLLLTDPLGKIELELIVTPSITQLIDRDGKKYVNIHLMKMIHQLMGMSIPIENLPYFLIGLPIQGTSFILDEHGLVKTIAYKHYNETCHLHYLAYHQDSQPKLPSRIDFTQGKRRIKLKMDTWILNK